MALFSYLVLFLSVLAGGALAFRLDKDYRPLLQVSLSFSGAYLLGITVLHLMPAAFSPGEAAVSLWVLGGFILQLLLEQLSNGVEHGHIHVHKEGQSGGRVAFLVLAGLSLHAFLEGLPLSGYAQFHDQLHQHGHGHNHLLYGIILHKIPAAFAIAMLLRQTDRSDWFIGCCLLIFASMSPLGALTGAILDLNPGHLRWILGLVIGSFLHISTTILFEMEERAAHRISWGKWIAILLGITVAILTI